jgi:hypothetical protein
LNLQRRNLIIHRYEEGNAAPIDSLLAIIGPGEQTSKVLKKIIVLKVQFIHSSTEETTSATS